MDYDEFVSRLSKSIDIYPEYLKKEQKYIKWLSDVELISRIEFGCNCNDSGCTGIKHERCCCYLCNERIGYLSHVYDDDIPTYYEKFDEISGFWEKGVGCSLPIHLRSKICLTFSCSGIRTNGLNRLMEYIMRDDGDVGSLIDVLREEKRYYVNEIK